ncbi:MAG TPA: hypothetical protein VLD58_07440, partial [Gemmatimonadales bacterium]|nr:hypothetical protein [Gemmatimonadales bacterium]
MNPHATVVRPGQGSGAGGSSSSALPTDLLSQAATRLRILALLYAAVFFLAGVLPMLVVPNDRVLLFSTPIQWVPPLSAIGFALLVAGLIGSRRLSPSAVTRVGLIFEVGSSYAIAVAEQIDARGFMPVAVPIYSGLSWVAVWIMLFTIVVPAAPRRALLAALAAVSAVPVSHLILASQNLTLLRLDPGQFFFWAILPYLLSVGMAYVGARVVYALGSEIKRARELGSYQLE